MGDFIWFLCVGIVLAILSLLFIRMGLDIWKKQKIVLVHDYHVNKLKEEDKPMFCKLVGIGILVIGVGFGLTAIWTVVSGSLLSLIPMAAGFVVGITMLVKAITKYNR
jgi:uncharacterized membrane protein